MFLNLSLKCFKTFLQTHPSGGRITTVAGERYRYNQAEPRHRSVIAANAALHAVFLDQFSDSA